MMGGLFTAWHSAETYSKGLWFSRRLTARQYRRRIFITEPSWKVNAFCQNVEGFREGVAVQETVLSYLQDIYKPSHLSWFMSGLSSIMTRNPLDCFVCPHFCRFIPQFMSQNKQCLWREHNLISRQQNFMQKHDVMHETAWSRVGCDLFAVQIWTSVSYSYCCPLKSVYLSCNKTLILLDLSYVIDAW